MPTGMIVMEWNERGGGEILASYPEELQIQENTLMQLYSQHEFSGEPGLVTLTSGAVNLASYYTGPETGVYVIMLLTAEEDGDVYEEGIAEITRQIVQNLDGDSLKIVLPSYFQRLSVYPSLTVEQRLAMIYNSEIPRMIIKRLRDESVISKSEIAIWLRDQYHEGLIDLESVIGSLVRNSVAKISSVQELSSDLLFLNQDILLLRIPPIELVKNPVDRHLPASFAKAYKSEVRSFFQSYHPEEQDTLDVIEHVILDPSTYEAFKLLREAIVTRNDLEKLRKKGVDDVDEVLKKLWAAKMIAVFKDESKTEYFCLVSDFAIEKFYPKYNLDNIRNQYRSKSQNINALVKALDLMKEEYYDMLKLKAAAKIAAETEK